MYISMYLLLWLLYFLPSETNIYLLTIIDFRYGEIGIAWPNLLGLCKEQSIIFSLNENV